MKWTLVLLVFHLASAFSALFLGLRTWWTPRGTPRHRRLGRFYVGTTIPLCASAWGLHALSGRAPLTLLWLAGMCLAAAIATPFLAMSPRRGLRAWHGHTACLSLACLGGAIVEVLLPGPWTWPALAAVVICLRAIPRPLPVTALV